MTEHALVLLTNGEAAQARLLAALACPDTGGALDVVSLETAGRAIRRAAIFRRDTGARVGKIENFQMSFAVYPDIRGLQITVNHSAGMGCL